jgi:hypothetical protein
MPATAREGRPRLVRVIGGNVGLDHAAALHGRPGGRS